MSMEVAEDIVKGSVNLSLGGGVTATRVFIVSEVTGNPSAIMFNAAVAGQIPRLGQPHPSISEIRVDSVTSTPRNSDICEVTVMYKTLSTGNSPVDEFSETQINLGASVQSVKTNKHFVGRRQELMKLQYFYPEGKSPTGEDVVFEVVPTANKEIAMPFASLSRRESKSPLQKAVDFVGTVNSRTFFGTKPKTWLCTKITGTSADSGLTFQVDYEFQYRSETWDVSLAFTDEETGRIPADIESQPQALKNFQLQLQKDFGELQVERVRGRS